MATKKPQAKRTTKTPAKKRASKKNEEMKSFRVAKDQPPFKSFKVTKQTVYWSILLLVIIATQLWILKLQMDVVTLTDALLTQ